MKYDALVEALQIINKATDAAWKAGDKKAAFSLARAFRYLVATR